jgi:uncharacterized protein YqeY
MQDYKQAMKDKDSVKSSVLSFLRSAMKNCAIEKRKEKLEDGEVVAVIKKQVKQRKDSIEQFKKGNRLDLADKETKEMEILEFYLPEAIPEGQLRVIVDEVISSLGEPVEMKAMGKIMKEVMAKAGSAADGKLISSIVKERLLKK